MESHKGTVWSEGGHSTVQALYAPFIFTCMGSIMQCFFFLSLAPEYIKQYTTLYTSFGRQSAAQTRNYAKNPS